MRKLFPILALFCLVAQAADTYIEVSGTQRRILRKYIEDSSVVRQVQRTYVENSGVVRLVYIFFSADAGADINTTSNPVGSTCSAVGGTGPFTYAWARTSGDTRITASPTNAAFTQFTRTGFALCEVASAIFQCTITDTATGLTAQDSVNVTMERPC